MDSFEIHMLEGLYNELLLELRDLRYDLNHPKRYVDSNYLNYIHEREKYLVKELNWVKNKFKYERTT